MLSLRSACNTPELQTAVPQQNQARDNSHPGPKKVIKLSRRIQNFLDKHTPPTSTCYLANPKSSSLSQETGEKSCNKEVTATLCQQNYRSQVPFIRSSADNFYIDVSEYTQVHGTVCAALSLLKSDMRSTLKRRLPIIPGATKQKMQRFCPTSIDRLDRQADTIARRTGEMLVIAEHIRRQNIFEHRCGAVLDLWHVAPTDTNPKDAQNIWIQTQNGRKSPFCYAKCLNYARTIRCYRTSDPLRGSFLLDENQASILAASVTYTLGAMFKHIRFRNWLLEKETLGNGEEIYTAPSILVQIIILLSLVARNTQPYARRVKPETLFEQREINIITLASNIFREQVLGKIILNKDEEGVSETKPMEFPRANKDSNPWSQPRLSTIQEDKFDDFPREEEEDITPHTAETLLLISSAVLNPSPLPDAPPLTPSPGCSPQYLSPPPHYGENNHTFDINPSPLPDAPPLTPSPGCSPQYLSPPPHYGENNHTFDINPSPLPDAPPLTPSTPHLVNIHRWDP
ncbi:hypothetical protein [Chlamydia buteonis]|uniref:Uncharacterized protein n=1 Tax=Chlamydia buteonis TaxID=2494525 RepID=A0ABX8LAR9_9CHLA|nr:hypothetical protein [Chlamydia buteonis]QXE26933.1 hypothetical protein HBN95_02035 [Chlamydia buteonis]QXE28120.1 hypothetical protein JJJ19_01110 [Chlamydia buteonis]